ncbi:MAG: hypothetical protein WCD11_07640, partial [Solirubrobacteraceae bacterium]
PVVHAVGEAWQQGRTFCFRTVRMRRAGGVGGVWRPPGGAWLRGHLGGRLKSTERSADDQNGVLF